MTLLRFPARPHTDDGADMLFHIPIRSAQADAAAAAQARHEATHDRRRREYEAMFNLSPYARNTVPPEKLTETYFTVIPPRRFVCNEVGGRPADDMPALLTKRGVFTAGGVVLILAAGWLGGILSVLAVL